MSLPPLWRAAPTRLAHRRGWFAAVAAAAALLAAAVTSVPLFERSVEAAAFTAEVEASSSGSFDRDSTDVRVTVPGVLPASAESDLRALLADLPDLGDPVVTGLTSVERVDPLRVTSYARTPAGQVRATLHHRDGAVELLAEALGVEARQGLWLSEETAAALDVGPGDRVELVVERRGEEVPADPPRATVAGVFPAGDDGVLPAAAPADAWVSTVRDLPPSGLTGPSALLLADRATFTRLAVAADAEPLWVADLTLAPDPTPEQVRGAAEAVVELGRAAFRAGSPIQRLTAEVEPDGSSALVASGLPEAVVRAERAAAAAVGQTRSLAWAGAALGVAAVCSAVVLLARSRRAELVLAAGLGLRPTTAGVLGAVETLPALVAGVVAGTAAGWGAVVGLGPSPRLGGDLLGPVVVVAGFAFAAAASAAGLATAVVARVTTRATTSGLDASRRRVPWRVLLVTATAVAAVAVADAGARPTGAVAVAFPMLVAATTAAVLDAVVRVRPRPRRRPRTPSSGAPSPTLGTPGWLARRRVRGAGAETTATVLVVAVGAATALWGVAVARGVDLGTADKVAAAAGATTTVDLEGSWQLVEAEDDVVPVPPLQDATFVWRYRVTLPPRAGQIELLAVDPATFDAVALWGESGALRDARDAVRTLGDATGPHEVRLIHVGPAAGRPPAQGTVNGADAWSVRYTAVGASEAFPGVTGRAVVVDAATLFAGLSEEYDPRVMPPRLGGGSGFRTQLWSARPAHEVEAALAVVGVSGRTSTVVEAERAPGLRGATWPLGYLVALGTCAALLGLVAVLVHAVRAGERDRVAELLLRRLGLTRRALVAARLREVGAVLAVAGAAAVIAVVGLARLGPSVVDPAPRLAPLVRPIVTWVDVAVLVVVLAGAAVVATAVARRRADAVPAGEVLRGEE